LNRGLKRVRDSGGAPEWLTHNEGEANIVGHAFPCALPDGKSVLFTVASYSRDSVSIAALTLKTGKWKIVLPQAAEPRYVPTRHLLFRSGRSTYAARFDVDSLQVVGPRIPVLQSNLVPAMSDTGCLVHTKSAGRESDDGQFPASPLVWVNRDGETEPLKAPLRPYFGVRLSPDGTRLALTIHTERGYDIWFYDLERETMSRLHSEGSNRSAAWTPDGRRIVFSSDHGGKAFNLFSAPADGSAQPQRLTQSDGNQFVSSISPDGRTLTFLQLGLPTSGDVYTLPLDGSGPAEPLIQTGFFHYSAVFSPDGRWLAYTSDETGQQEVFVQSYPDPAAKWQISNQGGTGPRWSPTGDELFYRHEAGMFAVSIETKPDFKPGRPQLLFEKPILEASPAASYDISTDGQRFIMPGLPEGDLTSIHQLVVVQNWFEELEHLAPPMSAAEQSTR
jgi:serine/threonine-protein kinase